jgi:hypothetical protein
MKVTRHKTEAVSRRYAIVSSGDFADAGRKLQTMTTATIPGTIGQSDENPPHIKPALRTTLGH